MKRVIEHIASIMQAARVCHERSQQALGGDAERWYRKHTAALSELLRDTLPHGSGFDNGVHLVHERSNEATQLVFNIEYHVMNDAGYYVGWAEFCVVATPAFVGGFDLDIEQTATVDDDAECGLADMIAETMYDALSAEYTIPSHYYVEC